MHAYIDIETLATPPRYDGVITEIGAVIFDEYAADPDSGFRIADRFRMDLSILDQILLGRYISPDTVAHRRINGTLPTDWTAGHSIHSAAGTLAAFLHRWQPTTVWMWGKDFDHPFLGNLFHQAGHSGFPAPYWANRCGRDTWKLAFGDDSKPAKRTHHALDDCLASVRDLAASLTHLNRNPANPCHDSSSSPSSSPSPPSSPASTNSSTDPA